MTYTPDSGLFASPLHIINVGADLFADVLTSQGVPVDRVAWKPAAGNSDTALSVLLDDPRVDHANQEAVQRMIGDSGDAPAPAATCWAANYLGAHVGSTAWRDHRRTSL